MANGFSNIKELSQLERWIHTPGRDNTTDLASPEMRPDDGARRLWEMEPEILWCTDHINGNNGTSQDVPNEFIDGKRCCDVKVVIDDSLRPFCLGISYVTSNGLSDPNVIYKLYAMVGAAWCFA